MKRIGILVLLILVVLTAVYTALTLYDKNLRFGRMWETPAVKPHEKKLLIMENGIVPFDGGEANYRAARPEELTSPFKSDDLRVIESGKALYFTYCAQCHGKYFDAAAATTALPLAALRNQLTDADPCSARPM